MKPKWYFALVIAGTASLLSLGSAHADATWLSQEFSGVSVATADVERFLNTECAPSGLDGLQMVAIQRGHGASYNLHIYCRPDHARGIQYRVTLERFERAKLGAIAEFAARASIKVGPFFFGPDGEGDGILIVQRMR